MDRQHRLLGRSATRRCLLRCRAALLAAAARRRAAAWLCRDPAEDHRAHRAGRRFCRAGAGGARRPRSCEPLRHRVAGTHRLAAACGRGAERARQLKRMRATAGVRSPLLAIFIVATLLFHGTAGAAQVQQGAIPFQGQMRTYSVYLPDNFGLGRPLPVVMMLHGGEGNGGRIAQQTGLPAFVDRDRFIAVFPDAGGRQWNDGRETTRSEIDDVGFLVAVVHDVVGRYGGDPARVFVGGASNGGMMVQRLACETTSVFNAYAVAIANMPVALLGACHPPRRAPMLFFESTDDPLMPWAGGEIRHGRFRG